MDTREHHQRHHLTRTLSSRATTSRSKHTDTYTRDCDTRNQAPSILSLSLSLSLYQRLNDARQGKEEKKKKWEKHRSSTHPRHQYECVVSISAFRRRHGVAGGQRPGDTGRAVGPASGLPGSVGPHCLRQPPPRSDETVSR